MRARTVFVLFFGGCVGHAASRIAFGKDPDLSILCAVVMFFCYVMAAGFVRKVH